MNERTKKRLCDAFAACRAVQQFTHGHDFAAYEQQSMLRSAVERQLEIIGEPLGQVSHTDGML